MHRKRIELLRDEKFKCECKWIFPVFFLLFSFYSFLNLGVDEYRTRFAGECRIDTECPASCHCERTTVDCSARGLKEIPRDIPLYTTEL